MARPLLALLFALLAANPGGAVETEHYRIYETKGALDDVQQFVEEAVIEQGLAITHRGDVSDMLDRTAEDVGAKVTVYKAAHYMEFCSAKLSRSAMEADPRNLAFCPFVIFLYTLKDETDTVHVGYRRPPLDLPEPSGAALRKVDAMLDAIVRTGLE